VVPELGEPVPGLVSWIKEDCVVALDVAVCPPTSVTEEEVVEVVCAGVMVPDVLGSAKTPATLVMTAATAIRAMMAVTILTLPVARLSPRPERHRPSANRPTGCEPDRKKTPAYSFAMSRGAGCNLFSGFPRWFHNLYGILLP
jgi:hypothetical protein